MTANPVEPVPEGLRTNPPIIHQALRRVLTYPPVEAAKQHLKNAYWSFRGLGLRNPVMPPRVASIMFVCKGNICRSPFAAARATQMLSEIGVRDIRCVSAGLRATQAATPPRGACEAAEAFGLSLASHVPLQVTAELIATHDMTVVMEAGQLLQLRHAYPDATNRVFLLPLLDPAVTTAYARHNISDPFGRSLAAFEICYRRIDGALGNLLHQIVSKPERGTASPSPPGIRDVGSAPRRSGQCEP